MKISLSTKFVGLGAVLVAVFNPLSVNLWGDALLIALDLLVRELVNVSNYSVAVGATLLVVGLILRHDASSKKETAKLKKLKGKNAKTPKYLEA